MTARILDASGVDFTYLLDFGSTVEFEAAFVVGYADICRAIMAGDREAGVFEYLLSLPIGARGPGEPFGIAARSRQGSNSGVPARPVAVCLPREPIMQHGNQRLVPVPEPQLVETGGQRIKVEHVQRMAIIETKLK